MKHFLKNIIGFFDKALEKNIGVYAAQASFFIVFSFVPFIMLLITLLRFVINVDIDGVLSSLSGYLPLQMYTLVSEVIMDVYYKSTSTGIISVTAISALWLASKGTMALYQGLNMTFCPERKLNYFKARGICVLYTLIFIAAMVVTIVLFGFGDFIVSMIPEHMRILAKIADTILQWKILVFPILTVVFALFYKVLPMERESIKKQLPGAMLAAAGWLIFSYIYSVYVNHFSNYSYVYGSLAAVVLLMLWLYICMNIFLLGAQFNMLLASGFFRETGK